MFLNFRLIRERIKSYFTKTFGYKRVELEVDARLDNVFSSESNKNKMERIYSIQQENNKKLQEMNEKIANTIKRIEEVKKRMVNAKTNEIRNKTQKEQADLLKRKSLPKLPFREFSEFEDLHEFIKFNRMNSITEEEVQSCNWEDTLKKLCSQN